MNKLEQAKVEIEARIARGELEQDMSSRVLSELFRSVIESQGKTGLFREGPFGVGQATFDFYIEHCLNLVEHSDCLPDALRAFADVVEEAEREIAAYHAARKGA
ncbi:hypothetical protein [Caballeronia sp. LZ035]|uniref:hypothetical protein n=1 Tax=Caballeronia sp. LZ035 TaxID=3038568 RepID=UPI00285BC5C1|nr:hypothetical protein [Caballeronia sp. LZ035]MDR5757651.1 hypothetical protein [Caballeronia sp. LZ035]